MKSQRCNDLFFVGAGFSKAISSSMPTLDQLSEIVLDAGNRIPFKTKNFEHVLTFLSQDYPWMTEKDFLKNRSLFLEVADKIKVHFQTIQSEIKKDFFSKNRWLSDLISLWHEQRNNIISMNYDLLIEMALEHLSIHHENAYLVPLTNSNLRIAGIWAKDDKETLKLHKLHGSINWHYSGRSSFYGETIYLNQDLAKIDNDNIVNKLLVDKDILIIPPITDKANFFNNETIRMAWREARTAISNAQRIYFIGYSLPETDMMVHFLFNSTMCSNKRIVIVNPDPSVEQRYKSILSKEFEFTYFDGGNDPLPSFVDKYCNGQI